MAALNLTIAVVDSPTSTNRGQTSSETGYTDATVATLLRDYLSPTTKLSEAVVGESILALFSSKSREKDKVEKVLNMCTEIAAQVPYDHPAQWKLAHLVHWLNDSPKFAMDKANISNEERIKNYVNCKAFVVNLNVTGVLGAPSYTTWRPFLAFGDMRSVFEDAYFDDEEVEDWERCAMVMGASQWVLWHGQTIIRFLLSNEVNPNDYSAFFAVGEKLEKVIPAVGPRSIERWRYWMNGFAAVETASYATEECKNVAKRAALLMKALEAGMLF